MNKPRAHEHAHAHTRMYLSLCAFVCVCLCELVSLPLRTCNAQPALPPMPICGSNGIYNTSTGLCECFPAIVGQGVFFTGTNCTGVCDVTCVCCVCMRVVCVCVVCGVCVCVCVCVFCVVSLRFVCERARLCVCMCVDSSE